MADNRYFSFTREELREEIRVEREEKERLRSRVNSLKTENRILKPYSRSHYTLDGEYIPNEAVTLARSYIEDPRYYTGRTPDADFNRGMRDTGISSSTGMEVYRAVKYNPSRLVSISAEDSRIRSNNAEIEELEQRIKAIDDELKLKKEAWEKPKEKVRLWERTRYYKYTMPGRNRRHFEVKVAMHFPARWRERDVKSYDDEVAILCDIILNNAFGPDIFDIPFNSIGWATGWEKGETEEERRGNSEYVIGEVEDKAAHYRNAVREGRATWTIPE